MALSVSYNGTNYELQISATGVLQIKTGSGSFVDSPLTGVSAARFASPWIQASKSDGTFSKMLVSETSTLFSSVQEPSIAGEYQNAVTANEPVIPVAGGSTPTPSPSGPVSTNETTLSMSGHQIVNGLPATTPTGFVVLSQLTELSQALTTVINAGDAAVQADIDALEIVVANLPAGLTMPTVQAAIDAAVANAVLNEIIDDAQKQALVDAALAQLSTIDTAVISRVGSAEALIASLEPRVTAVEAKNVLQDAAIADGVAKDVLQDVAISAAAAAAQSAILTNNAQNERINQSELGISMLNQVATPIEVKVVNGTVTEVIGCAMNMVSIDNSNDRHMQVSINLGTDTNGQRRVLQGFRLMPNGTERDLGGSYSRNAEIYIAAFLKTCDGSTSVNFVLN